MGKKSLIWVFYILAAFFIFNTAYLRTETPPQPTQSQPKKEATLKTKAHLSEEKSNEIILVRGETNLPPGTLLQIGLKAGIWLLNAVDNTQLTDMTNIAVNNDGQYMVQFNNFKTIFDPEYYEITVSVSPEQPRDALLAEGFTENTITQLKDYYLVNVLSLKLPARRQKLVTVIIQLIEQLLQSHQELLDKTINIEKMKEGDNEIEEKLKRAFGIYKTKKSLFVDLSNDWLNREKAWLIKVNKIVQQSKEERVFLSTTADIYNTAYRVIDYYYQYRQAAFDDKNTLKETLLVASTLPQLSPPLEIKKQLIDSLENEVALKICRDIIVRLEEIVLTFQECTENGTKANEIWSNFKTIITSYLNDVKQELLNYEQANLFLETPPNKEKKKETYNQIMILLDLTTALVDKFGLRLVDQTNKKLEADTRELIDLINQKAKNLSVR